MIQKSDHQDPIPTPEYPANLMGRPLADNHLKRLGLYLAPFLGLIAEISSPLNLTSDHPFPVGVPIVWALLIAFPRRWAADDLTTLPIRKIDPDR